MVETCVVLLTIACNCNHSACYALNVLKRLCVKILSSTDLAGLESSSLMFKFLVPGRASGDRWQRNLLNIHPKPAQSQFNCLNKYDNHSVILVGSLLKHRCGNFN